MDLNTFKNWAIKAGQVGNPTTDPNSQFIGECVSLIQQYLNKVYGIAWVPRGDARSWGTNGNVLSYFDRVNSIQAGDIVVYPAVPGNPFGHIAIALGGGQMLEQNGRIARRVSVSPLRGGQSAILRRKGTDIMKPSAQQVKDVFTQFLPKTPPNQTQINHYVNQDIRLLFQDVLFAQKPGADEVKTAFKNQGLTPSQGQVDYYTQYSATQLYRDLNAVAQTQGTVAEQKKMIDELIAKNKELDNPDNIVVSRNWFNSLFDKLKGIIGK